ncbi:integumentary mucin C.1-like [Xiphophorus couchianus]|uniref:integumentary mucin C.1-like n=1 Tax=Xiphophorus couchianus TaxID=32473 RepID=UPI0010162FF4|nr:integumentary mucin C.1-like [Xiphophorus couchianus]
MNGTQAEVGVEFNKSTPAETIPKAEDVQATLKEAVNNPNSTLNVTFDVNSIQIISVPATSAPVVLQNTTTTTNETAANITTGVTTTTPGTSTASNATTTTNGTAANITTGVATTKPGTSTASNATTTTNETTANITTGVTTKPGTSTASNATTTTNGTAANITTGVTTKPGTSTASNATTTTTAAPTTITIASTTTTAAPTKPKTTPTTPTTLVTTTTTTTEAPPPVFVVAATVVEPFVEELNDRHSVQFKALEVKVIAVYDIIYRSRYGILFIRSFIISFKPAFTRFRMNGTQAEVGVEFNKSTPAETIPKAEDVQATLKEAVNNPNSTLNVTFDVNSIQIISVPATSAPIVLQNTTTTTNETAANITTGVATTTPGTSTASNATTTTNGTAANITTGVATTKPGTSTASNATTTAVTTITTKTTTVVQTVRQLTFRSPGETFTTDLLDSTSTAFKNRASLLKSTLEPFYKQSFSSFSDLTVKSFRSGSIINEMELRFVSASAPTGSEIAQVLVKVASNITAFTVDAASIFVDGTQVSSGVSHKISLIMAFCMVLLSRMLSSQH